jgi:hypothetical protein
MEQRSIHRLATKPQFQMQCEDGHDFSREEMNAFSKSYLWALCRIHRPAKRFKVYDRIADWNSSYGLISR